MATKTFTTGEVLTASATNEFLANSGLVYISSTTYSGSSAVSINNCFSSAYTNYRIIGSHIPSSSLVNFNMRLRASTTDQSGANYQATNARLYNTNAQDSSSSGATTMYFSNGGIASFPYAFAMDIYDPFGNTPTLVQHDAVNFEAAVAGVRWWAMGGYKANYSADGFTVYPTSGTWTGTITVYGYRKA
jgi:hypothetical protein